MEYEEIRAALEHLVIDLHAVAKQVAEIHAELEEFRPVLAMFKPRANGGGSDLQRAGVLRAMRRAGRAQG